MNNDETTIIADDAAAPVVAEEVVMTEGEMPVVEGMDAEVPATEEVVAESAE